MKVIRFGAFKFAPVSFCRPFFSVSIPTRAKMQLFMSNDHLFIKNKDLRPKAMFEMSDDSVSSSTDDALAVVTESESGLMEYQAAEEKIEDDPEWLVVLLWCCCC